MPIATTPRRSGKSSITDKIMVVDTLRYKTPPHAPRGLGQKQKPRSKRNSTSVMVPVVMPMAMGTSNIHMGNMGKK